MATHQKARAATTQMAFCNLDPGIQEVFELLKLTDVFTIYEDEQKGLEAMSPSKDK
jgi:anti-anti-sigma regulatory factor